MTYIWGILRAYLTWLIGPQSPKPEDTVRLIVPPFNPYASLPRPPRPPPPPQDAGDPHGEAD
jgi:hypothetical protein